MSLSPVTIVIDRTPPSLNDVVGQGHWRRYHTIKKQWQAILRELLAAADTPRMGRVLVEGVVTFPDRRKHDQGNYRFVLEKALGDALVVGGWLVDDDWGRYEFGNLAADYAKGVRRTVLTLFPLEAMEAAA
jgi:hypothetical protein